MCTVYPKHGAGVLPVLSLVLNQKLRLVPLLLLTHWNRYQAGAKGKAVFLSVRGEYLEALLSLGNGEVLKNLVSLQSWLLPAAPVVSRLNHVHGLPPSPRAWLGSTFVMVSCNHDALMCVTYILQGGGL